MRRDQVETVVEMAGVTKDYGGARALAGVDLTIRRGERVALLGPNGAGKTTTIHILLGLLEPTRGEARLFGAPPGAIEARRRRGAMLQDAGVPPLLRVHELLAASRSCYPSPRPLQELLDVARLAPQRLNRIDRLSGGQRRRLLFAVALSGDPELLFLDEPTVGMDVESRRAFRAEIRRFGLGGGTVLLTTHDLTEADELADRVVVLHRGLVVANDSPARIKAMTAGRHVRFRTPRPLASRDLDGLPLEHVAFGQDSVEFLCSDPVAIVVELVRRGISVTDLEIVGAALEEAFLALTRQVPETAR